MKSLLVAVTLILITSTSASADVTKKFKYKRCQFEDWSFLNAAHIAPGLKGIVRENLYDQHLTCKVLKPRFLHPQVCGALVKKVDTFRIHTKDALYKIVVDSSYRSCLEIYSAPAVKSFYYEAK